MCCSCRAPHAFECDDDLDVGHAPTFTDCLLEGLLKVARNEHTELPRVLYNGTYLSIIRKFATIRAVPKYRHRKVTVIFAVLVSGKHYRYFADMF